MNVRKAAPTLDADCGERALHPGVEDAHPLLRRFFTALAERRLSWVLLRVPSDLAAPTGDVDLLVAREDCEELLELAGQLGFVALPGWDSAPDLLLVGYDPPSDRWLVLDIVTTIAFRSAGWQSEEVARRVLRRRRRNAIAVPADGDAFWLLLLHCLLDKDGIAAHYRPRLTALAPDAGQSVVAPAVLPPPDARWAAEPFAQAVVQRQWAALEQRGRRLTAELRRARPISNRVAALALRVRAAARRVLALRRRRGVSVALLGPNGVGKSTLAAGLRDSFPLESRIVYMGIWKAGATTYGGTVGAALVRPLRIWRRYLLARYHQARGRLVVFDRYVYEAALPPHPPFRTLKRLYHWLLRHAVPMPDVVVLLDVAGSAAYARKQENPPDELERERHVYRGLATSVPGLALVDASRDAASVRADVMAIVWRRTVARWRRDGDAEPEPPPPAMRLSIDEWLANRDAPSRAELAYACALVPRILAGVTTFLPRSVAHARVVGAQLTGTRMTLITLAAGGERPCAVIKMPMTPAGAVELEREGDMLAELQADERLEGWRRLVPRPLAAGSVLEQSYRIDSFVHGRELLGRLADPARRDLLLETAAETIHVLHSSTAATVAGDAGDAKRWIDARLADLAVAGAGRDARFAPRAALLRAELHDAVIGRPLTTSWIHGDYWPGNLLVADDGATVQGVVDWGAADPMDLPLHDLLHLVMYTRRVVGGQGLGQIVCAQLRAPHLSAVERRLLERHVGWPPGGLPSYRDALILYWLRHVALHARQHGPSADWRYRLWEQRNVHAVLGVL